MSPSKEKLHVLGVLSCTVIGSMIGGIASSFNSVFYTLVGVSIFLFSLFYARYLVRHIWQEFK